MPCLTLLTEGCGRMQTKLAQRVVSKRQSLERNARCSLAQGGGARQTVVKGDPEEGGNSVISVPVTVTFIHISKRSGGIMRPGSGGLRESERVSEGEKTVMQESWRVKGKQGPIINK